MKTKRYLLVTFLLAFVLSLSLLAFTGCEDPANTPGGNTVVGDAGFDYDTEMLSEKDNVDYGYNNNLFYVNNLDFKVADPSVIYITEGKDMGYFYCYGTSDDIGGHGFQAWRSTDLSHWECTGVALKPEAWAINCYWAPEVIYDDGMYYMFFGAYNLHAGNRLCISVATSETPDGPFSQPYGIRDYYGNNITDAEDPMFDFTIANPKLKTLQEQFVADHPDVTSNLVKTNCLDASPFIDPVTGDRYLLFSYYDNYGEGSFIYGVKMLNWFTPDYSTLTCLTYPGYDTVQHGYESAFGEGVRLREGGVNEGPFMICHGGKYYLTCSVFGYTDSNYRVIQAIGDSPLGPFRKISPDDGGKVISTDVANWTHIVSAGHHSFVTIGDDLFIAYHTFKNRNDISGSRALALDSVLWTENSEGIPVMHTNGPTWSVQPLPEALSGYKNIAESATIKATNTANGSDVSLLNDGMIKYQEFDLAEEYEANAGKSVITLTWDSYKTARAIMIYNSYDYDKTFVRVASIEMQYLKADGTSGTVVINDLPFDWDWHFESDYEFMRPGGAAIAEFYELPVNKMVITINTPSGADRLALGEIVVLGKDGAEGVSSFNEYEYVVKTFNSGDIIRESVTFGAIEGTDLATEYGYDVSHDDGTENAYVTQNAPGDMSCYFKDVYSTEFYVEAEFTVTSAHAFAYNDYLHDPYPKFGLAVSCDDDDIKNTIFFYVDAVNFSNKVVGVAQRMLDNSNWDWDATEQTVGVGDISYTNGNYVKLAIIRHGAQFYFLCNDEVVIQYSTFNVFNDRRDAGVGFRCFSTPMKVRNYYATQDSAVVAAKTQLYTGKLIGETFGSVGGYITTSGWDLTTDRGDDAYAVQSLGGDQYAYFKDVNSTSFYAEMELTVTKDLGDPYPKFGFASKVAGNTFFFYIDGSSGYNAMSVGYVNRNTEDSNWTWNVVGESGLEGVEDLFYSNGQYAKLGILRQGNVFKLYVNDTLMFTVEDVRGFDENTASVISVLSFTTGITIRNYFATTDTSKFPA